nr:immunoglobulin heavy chain junction region [Mus musculus]NSM05196.1 immunoglobulin heavy chain junction region [Mus musculus]NSM05553.1 immunoglobulin heavy chain junction region [Mus musculus]NSM06367.1 immunoglobulin heavy chain junction region [Mus musculus]
CARRDYGSSHWYFDVW